MPPGPATLTNPLLTLVNCFPAFTRGRSAGLFFFFFKFLAICGCTSRLQAFLLSRHPESPTSGVGTAPCAQGGGPGGCQSRPALRAPRPASSLARLSPSFLLVGNSGAPPRPSRIKAMVARAPARAPLQTRSLQSGTWDSLAFPCSPSSAPRNPPLSSPRRAALRPQPCAAPWPPSPTPAWRGKRSEFV